MRRPTRDGMIAFGFIFASFVLALWQRPGWATSDTKIDLHVNPADFLGEVASVWTHSIDLGAVHGAQYGGYLWPVGPFFALFNSIGIEPWIVHRLWLGTIFALSAWGVLRLLDLLVGRPRGIAHVVAAALYVLNPYTTMFTGRTSIILLGYAALPWMLIVVHHGVRGIDGWRSLRGWWWAGAFALILTSVGGGINGAVVGWMLVGPLVLLVYEPLIGNVRWRDSAGFVVRMGVLGTLASLWWIVPLVVHAGYGIDFLQFTEQPRSIWATNSVPEVLRLMGYWTSYTGVGFSGAERAFFTESGTMLFNPLVVGASLILPALALAGFMWTRRWRYAPFFLLLLLVGVAIEAAGFPKGTPSRDTMEWIYRNVPLVRFMRTTQKAAPLVAIGGAGLLGIAAQLAWIQLRGMGAGRMRRVALVAAPAALAALIALAALPLARGTAVEEQLTWKRIPSAWTQLGNDLDSGLAPNSRVLGLPGQIFGYYQWGGTIDSILPRVTNKPSAVRYETPYGDPRATDLLWTVDRLTSQRRLVPGQLPPLLGLMGAGAVVTGSDDETRSSGAAEPALAASVLAEQGLDRPTRGYGPVRKVARPAGDIEPPPALPQVRRYDVPVGRGLVHVTPDGPATIMDGGAEGLAGLAAFGALPARRPIQYAGDLTARELARQAERGADVVVSDSNRRRRFVPEFGRQNLGITLRENEPLNENFALIEPFPERGTDAQTVSVLEGARSLRAPYEGGLFEFPEHAPFAAFDGDRTTTWAADRYFHPRDRWIEVGFDRPRDVPYVDLEPIRDPFGVEEEVDVNGVRAKLGPGVTRVPLRLKDVSKLRVTITRVDQPGGELRGGGGFREIRIPGVRVRQRLRPPVLAAKALAGRDLGRSALSYLFERTTADEPFRQQRQTGSPLLELRSNREDPERQIDRTIFAPAARSYALDAWVHPSVDAPDSQLDRLAGRTGAERFDSSGRFQNQPRNRASSAFDGRPESAWIGTWARPSSIHPWISWSSPRALRVSRLTLTPSTLPIRRPTLVRVSWAGGSTPPLRVAADGSVQLPRPVSARRFRLTVLDARFPAGTSPAGRATRAVGIASLDVPGLPRAGASAGGAMRAGCGSVRVELGGRQVALRPEGSIAALEAGKPLRARGCDGQVPMGEGVQKVRSLAGPFSVDLLRLRSEAPQGQPAPSGGGRVLDTGNLGNSSLKDVRVDLDGPSWLVLGQSFSKGWQARCDGRSLGEPVPVGGYANGWRAPGNCGAVEFSFGPQSAARAGYVISAVVCLLLLAFMLVSRLRGRWAPARLGAPAPLPVARAERMPLPRAALVGFLATLPLAFLFAARGAVVIFPVLTLILWRGAGQRLLTGIAALLLGVAVPLMYALASPQNRGGYNFEYSTETIWAHWVGVAGIILLMVVCARTLASAYAARRSGGTPPGGDMPLDPDLEPPPRSGAGRPDLVGARRAGSA